MKTHQTVKNFIVLTTLLTSTLFLGACQTIKTKFGKQSDPNSTQTANTQSTNPSPLTFAITGKIGITSVDLDGKKTAHSAFYAWGQEDDRFAIDLTGALGLGATTIRYDGKQAVLISEQTGEIVADNPEQLLLKSTGWHAPISHLPFWIMGINAPSDQQKTSSPITTAQNGDWQATFDYNKIDKPYRIRMTHADGHRVVLSINGR